MIMIWKITIISKKYHLRNKGMRISYGMFLSHDSPCICYVCDLDRY